MSEVDMTTSKSRNRRSNLGHTDGLSAPERAALRDAQAPYALALALSVDDHFADVLTAVRSGEMTTADAVRPYVRSHTPAQHAFRHLLELAGQASSEETIWLTLIAAVGMAAAFPAGSRHRGDSVRSHQQRTLGQTERGVKVIVRRGAARCIRCGGGLAHGGRPVNRVTNRRYWRDYCEGCDPIAEPWKDTEAVRVVLDGFGDWLVRAGYGADDAVQRRRQRRTRRSSSGT